MPRFSLPPSLQSELAAAFAGFCGMLVTMGLSRFAFTPLIPALIEEGWFVPAETFLIGVSIVIGYFIGAIFITRKAGTPHAATWVRCAMVLVTLAFFACARPMPFAWFVAWMALAGAASGVGLILSAQVVLAMTAPSRHGLIGGLVVAGIGCGIILSGVLVSLLAEASPTHTFYALSALGGGLTLISWRLWPTSVAGGRAEEPSDLTPADKTRPTLKLRKREPFQLPLSLYATYFSYGLGSFSIAFPQLLFPDFIVRGKGFSLSDAGDLWLFTGIGAVLGSLLVGGLGDKLGMARCYRFCLLLFGLSLLALTLPLGLGVLIVLSVMLGIFNFGQVPMVVGRLRRIFAKEEAAARRAWGIASLVFALGQVTGMLFLSLLLEATDNYILLCWIAAGFSISGAGVEVFVSRRVRKAQGAQGAQGEETQSPEQA